MTAYDVIVVGGGAAGMAAASEAAARGLRVALVDEAAALGGQVYRARPAAFAAPAESSPGDVLRDAVRASDVTVLFHTSVWNVSPGYLVDVVGPSGNEQLEARALIVATGTHERFVPVNGWTLPGVLGLGAATVLMKSQRILPGRNVVVAGVGPLLMLVASMIVDAGGRVAALVDANGVMDWAARAPAMLSRPDLVWQGAGWWRQLMRARTRVFRRHVVSRIRGDAAVSGVELSRIDASDPVATIDADAVCTGYGLCPATEMARLLGVRHHYVPELGGWIPDLDDDFRAARDNLYVVGDAAGVRGVAAAPLSGRIAAVAAARDLGASDDVPTTLKSELRRAARFGRAMSSLAQIPSGLVARIAPETIVCRCEDVARERVDDALAAGCREINQVKAATRCGMGPCQGRMCGDAVASIMAARLGSREAVGQLTARPPFRPVATKALTGSFDYDDVVMSEHAPT